MGIVEDVLKDGHPKEFPEKVLREIADRAREARRQHRREESAQHYDKALSLLDGLAETERQMRWRADLLLERGHAVGFLEAGSKQEIADLEASVEAARQLGDRSKYAEHLMGLATAYSNAKAHHKSLEAYEEAASIYQSVGDAVSQGSCLYWLARRRIPWFAEEEGGEGNYQQALEGFRRAAVVFRQEANAPLETMALGAVGLLEATGPGPGEEMTTAIGCGSMNLQRSPDALTWRGQPGFSRNASREDLPWGALVCLVQPQILLHLPAEVGKAHTSRTFAYGVEEMHATTTVTRLDAEVETPAGDFRGCLEQVTEFERKGEDPSERYRRLNLRNSGTRRTWFAPGVGVVRIAHKHGDGMVSETQLLSYEVPDKTGDHFPLELDSRWQYRVTNNRSTFAILDTSWVAARTEDTYHIAQYHFSERT